MVKLVIRSGPRRGEVFFPPPGVDVEIGRSEGCFVRIDEPKVSRRHALLSPAGVCHRLRDLESSNGTFVNDRRVQECPLRSGDTIRVGDTELAYLLVEKDPWIGRVLAGYRVVDSLGRGGMGHVYLARQLSLDRLVALKILAPELSRDEEFVARLVEEARAMAKLSHPHVVQVHNVGSFEGTCFLSMEYLEGGSLRQLIDAEGSLPPRRALAIALDAADALVWAEAQGIVHRDIKPGNILLDAHGAAKVGDFGLAADLAKTDLAREEGHVRGSPHFMAPEQAQGKLPDHRSDIYALGATLYTALTGKVPFSGRTLREILAEKLREDPPPVSGSAPGTLPDLDAIVAKAMARQPEDRYQHAADFARDLERVARRLEGAGAARYGGAARRLPGAGRRGARLALAAGAAALAVLAAVSYGLLPRERGAVPAPPPAAPPAQGPLAVPGPGPDRPEPAEKPSGPTEPGAPGPPPSQADARPTGRVPPPPIETRAQDLERSFADAEALVLESRFEEALRRLEDARRSWPDAGTRIDAEIARVRAAEILFRARSDALALERQGDFEGAAAILRRVLDTLPERHRIEARVAIEAIEGRRKALSPEGGETP